jgi:chaperonin GroES
MATAAQDILADDDDAVTTTSPLAFLAQIAQTDGDLSDLFDDQTLTTIGADVLRDYETDLSEQTAWRATAEKALKRACQERDELAHDAPSYRKSNVNYPILAVAALQFNARAYPAICKSGNMVKVKVIGSDKGRPKTDQQGQPIVQLGDAVMTVQQAQAVVAQAQANAQAQQPPQQPGQDAPPPVQVPTPEPLWDIAPGAKQLRADRVGDYLNVFLEYRMDGWEEDTDQMLFEIPIVGCGFRKLWRKDGKQQAAYVSALDLVVPMKAKTLDDAPRSTEKLNDQFPFQIRQRMNSGEYRRVVLTSSTDDEEHPRLLLEQHRWLDLDGDGVDEPYIVTLDHETAQVLRIVANFTEDDVHIDGAGNVVRIDKGRYYIKYPFLPHAKHVFYGMGFGHLVEQLGDIINTTLNQFFDAMHAQIAGGGFIAAGLRLQGNNRSETIRWMPGEWKQVPVSGADLRAGLVERTFPNISPIQFNILEFMLAAAKDITSVKDILTGDVPNTAPVGTTLAIVEQAQTVFTAIYKRIYRSAGDEFQLIFENLARYGGEEAAEDYSNVLDDPAADFEKDFAESDVDIKPVADPASVTRMQQIAKAQFLLGLTGRGLNDMEIYERVLQAGDIENPSAILPQGPSQPDPLTIAKIRQAMTASDLNEAKAAQAGAAATKTAVDVGHQLGESEGYGGGLPSLGGSSGDAMGAGGGGTPGGGQQGDMGAGIVGAGGE